MKFKHLLKLLFSRIYIKISSGPLKGKKWIAVSGYCFIRGDYEPYKTEAFLNNFSCGNTLFDIGAHIGTFSILSSSKVGSGKVFAIEASKDSFNLLRINVALNQCANISVYHLAITDKEGTCTLYHGLQTWGHSTVKKRSKSSETVESCTLSTFLERNRIAAQYTANATRKYERNSGTCRAGSSMNAIRAERATVPAPRK